MSVLAFLLPLSVWHGQKVFQKYRAIKRASIKAQNKEDLGFRICVMPKFTLI